jgi:hypothetical protein
VCWFRKLLEVRECHNINFKNILALVFKNTLSKDCTVCVISSEAVLRIRIRLPSGQDFLRVGSGVFAISAIKIFFGVHSYCVYIEILISQPFWDIKNFEVHISTKVF